jgi:hypothetical protein
VGPWGITGSGCKSVAGFLSAILLANLALMLLFLCGD